MTQISTASSSCASHWKMWHIQVFGFIYLTAVCAAQDPPDVTSVFEDVYSTPLTTVASTVWELPVPRLQRPFAWLDVFPSEKVEFSCSINGSSDWTFIWFRDQLQIQDSDRSVSLAAEGSVLTITAETQTDSGSYSCKGQHKTKGVTTAASNSLTITVYENQPKPIISRNPNIDKMFPFESVTFTCTVTMSLGWEYLWYHNGKEISASNDNAYTIVSMDNPDSGQYHCRAKRGNGSFYTEESGQTTLQVSDPPKPSLKVRTPWLDVFEEETVEFSCEVDSADWTFTWYKNQEKLEEDLDLILADDGSLLNITSIAQTHQGVYTCRAHLQSRRVVSEFSNTTNLTVYENLPKPTLRKNPGFSQMYVGETVNFTCNVAVSSGWEYQFYKDGDDFLDNKFTGKTVSIHLGPSDGGIYACKATRNQTSTDLSEEIQQAVLETPVPSVKLSTQWPDVFPDESVKMSCGMDGSSGWTFTWYRQGREVRADSLVSFDANGANLSISSASDAHAGQYNCKGHLKDRSVSSNSSSGLTLTVYDKKPRVTLTQDPDYDVMFPGESVSFSCHINVSSEWKYLWYQDRNQLNVSGNKHTISPIGTIKRGSYTCKAKRGTDQVFHTPSSQAIYLQVEENKPKPLMTQQPDVDKVYTGESVSFECKVKLSSGWTYHWYKDGGHHTNSSFNINNASLSDSGTYECMAIRDRTTYSTERSDRRILHVSEIPVPTSELITKWPDVFPTERVELRCVMDGSSDWTYTWYKDGETVLADDTVSFGLDGTTLSISSASASRRGQYSCSAKLKSRSVSSRPSSGLTLNVYDTKPRVTLMQNPAHHVMHTGDSISFSCHINVSSGWEYLWYKDGSPLIESSNNHYIASVVTTNTGSFTCQAKRGRNAVFLSDQSQAVKLNVMERPQANIILLTGWSEVFSTDSLVLRCGVQESQDMWNYTWFKEDQSIDAMPAEKHIVTPQNDPKQSLYTCKGIRTGRPYYSKRSDSFNTKNLLLKRRVLLSISGCIFFGIIAVFLGCIILRVFRKPADHEEKPEEADLFLSMSLRKTSTDAPCPLVQYITDAALNASSKEEDENGTICSETTPLPITSQEDQAVTTESHDTTESNGGLVSFRQ